MMAVSVERFSARYELKQAPVLRERGRRFAVWASERRAGRGRTTASRSFPRVLGTSARRSSGVEPAEGSGGFGVRGLRLGLGFLFAGILRTPNRGARRGPRDHLANFGQGRADLDALGLKLGLPGTQLGERRCDGG